MWTYNALVTKVYDGDTVTADIDLGFGVILRRQSLRLLGINAPEVRGETKVAGAEARDALASALSAVANEVILKTYKDLGDKYGRWLATIWIGDRNINAWMIESGFAIPYMEKAGV